MSYYDIPALSNSGMSALNPDQSGSPRRFKNQTKNPNKYDLSLDRGSLLHLAILEPHKFITQEVDRPSGMMGDFCEIFHRSLLAYKADKVLRQLNSVITDLELEGIWRYAVLEAGYKTKAETIWKNFQEPGPQAYYAYLQTATPDKLPVTRETREILDACIHNITYHPLANRLLLEPDADDVSSWNELEVIWTEEVVIEVNGELVTVLVPCKAKIDRLRYNSVHQLFQNVDLKTTSSGIGKFGDSYRDYRYYRQNAFYDLAIRHFAVAHNIPFQGISHYNVVTETTGLNEAAVFKTTEEWLAKGQQEYQEILSRYAWHIHDGRWDYPREYYLNNGLYPLPSL